MEEASIARSRRLPFLCLFRKAGGQEVLGLFSCQADIYLILDLQRCSEAAKHTLIYLFFSMLNSSMGTTETLATAVIHGGKTYLDKRGPETTIPQNLMLLVIISEARIMKMCTAAGSFSCNLS